MEIPSCKVCGRELSVKAHGPVPEYCTETSRCRTAAYRARKAGAEHPKIEPVSVPVRLRTPDVDDIAALVSETRGLEAAYRFASARADFRLRPMCTRMAEAIGEALSREGLR